ncbi:MAG: cyclic nucleotide-binding domain-containing protein, partial [Microcystaceae cyanobacterium]
MEIQQLCKGLKQTSLGKNLSDEEVYRLAQAGTVEAVASGTTLLAEGTASDSLLVLLQGEAEVIKGIPENSHRIGYQSQGSVLGEVGLLLDIPRTATVRAISSCSVFRFKREDLEKLIVRGDRVASKLAIQLARGLGLKLQMLTDEVVQLLDEHDELLKIIDRLQHSSSQENLEQLRHQLVKRAQQLRESQLKVKQQLNHLNTEIIHTKIERRAIEIMIAIAAGIIAAFISIPLLKKVPGLFPLPLDAVHPASIPYINTEV